MDQPKPKKPSRATRDGFNRAFLAALAAEAWPKRALPVFIEMHRFRDGKYRSPGVWHVKIEADWDSEVLGGWQIWHLYGGALGKRPGWSEVSVSLACRLEAIAEAAWEAGVRYAKVTFEGTDAFTAHELLALETEAGKWPSSPGADDPRPIR